MSSRVNLAGRVLFVLGVAILLCATSFAAQTTSAQQVDRLSEVRVLETRLSEFESPPVEARAGWISNRLLANLKGRAGVASFLDKVESAGFNIVLVEAFYRGNTLYPGPYQDERFAIWDEDPMKVLAEETRKRGLEFHAWVWGLSEGFGAPGRVLEVHPEWADVMQNGSMVSQSGAYWLNPALPEVREFLIDQYMHILDTYAPDGLHIDYIRYNDRTSGDYGYSPWTLHQFERDTGFDSDHIVLGTEAERAWQQWREGRIHSLVAELSDRARRSHPETVISAAVGAELEEARWARLQNWKYWVDRGWLEVVYPMAYSSDMDLLKIMLRSSKDTARSTSYVYPGLAVWANTPESILDQIETVRNMGFGGVALFSLDHFTDVHFDYLKRGPFRNPAVVPNSDPVGTAAAALESLWKEIESYSDKVESLRGEELKQRVSLALDAVSKVDSGRPCVPTELESLLGYVQSQIDRLGGMRPGEGNQAAGSNPDQITAYQRIGERLALAANILEIAEYQSLEHPQVEPDPAPLFEVVPDKTVDSGTPAGAVDNLAIHATVTVDSCYKRYSAVPVNDGYRNDQVEIGRWTEVAWASRQDSDPHWIELSWPQPQRIASVDIYWARDRGNYYASKAYEIQYWDGRDWITVYAYEAPAERLDPKRDRADFGPIETTRLRIYQPGGKGPAGREGLMWVAEVEVFPPTIGYGDEAN